MNVFKRNNIILVTVAFAIFLLTLIDYVTIKKVTDTQVLMDTPVSITVYGMGKNKESLKTAIDMAFDEIERVEAMMSRFIPESNISRINNPNSGHVFATEETVDLLEVSKRVDELTDGAFDITIGNLVDLWCFTCDDPQVPDDATIKELITHIGNDKVSVIYSEGVTSYSAHLMDPKAKLDLGGIAKGYAIKRAGKVLSALGVKSGIVDAGGDMVVIGDKKGKPFRVGIKSPDGDGMVGIINAANTSIVTSGDYERYFVKDGLRYHHILDPATGYPARKCRSVTVIAEDATIADALSTAIFVMGAQDGLAVVDQLDGVEAVIIDAGNEMHLSKGAAKIVELKQ